MDDVLRGATLAGVIGLGAVPVLAVASVEDPNRTFAAIVLIIAGGFGVHGAVRREPFGVRVTSLVYAGIAMGTALFGAGLSLPDLLGYVSLLLGLNVLAFHLWAYGPVLAAFKDEDAISRRARGTVLRSLAFSGAAVGVAFGGSVALLPLFAVDLGPRDPVSAFALALALLAVFALLALLPDDPWSLRRRRQPYRSR